MQYFSVQPPLTVRGPAPTLTPQSQAVRTRIQLPFKVNPSDVSPAFVTNIGLMTPNARSSFTQDAKQSQKHQHSNLISKHRVPEPDQFLARDESLAQNIMAQSAFDSNVKSTNDSLGK
jgi:hypothetical protein